MKLVYLNGEAIPWAGKRPAVGNLDAVCIAIVAVVDLRRQAAQRRLGVADQAQQQAGLRVEVEAERRLAFGAADDLDGVVAVDLIAGPHNPDAALRFYIGGKMQVGVQSRSNVFFSVHDMRWTAGHAEPAGAAVEGRDAIAAGQVHDGDALVGCFSVDINGEVLAAERGERASLDATGNFLHGPGAAGRR